MHSLCAIYLWAVALLLAGSEDRALHVQVDTLVAARAGYRGFSPLASDADFVRRVYLDLAGRIPSATEARSFLDDRESDRRARLIDNLLGSADYPRRMGEWASAFFMGRVVSNSLWDAYLLESFTVNKPWDRLCREILRAAPDDEAARGAAFFMAQRLNRDEAGDVDRAALTRDIGRLFLGKDLRCCQCHDHPYIDGYKQQDFQGLFAFVRGAEVTDLKKLTVGESPILERLRFTSVFTKVTRETWPRVPGMAEVRAPLADEARRYVRPPDLKAGFPGVLKFSPLAELSKQLPIAANADFSRTAVNRLWTLMMGVSLVDPPDLDHEGNPSSNPDLLNLLVKEFVAHGFDVKWLLRELAVSDTYQRSTLLPNQVATIEKAALTTANEKRMSPEQLFWSVLEATGERAAWAADRTGLDALRGKFLRAFAGPQNEAEDDDDLSPRAALFLLNDDVMIALLRPRNSNLVERLAVLADSDRLAEELYVSVLTRRPTPEERADVASYVAGHAADRAKAIERLAWSLLASAEFLINH